MTERSAVALSEARGSTETPLLEETIDVNLRRAVARFGAREALVVRHQNLRMTYAEFDQAIEEVAKGLLAQGIEQGDRVALWSPNRVEWTLLQFATARVGAVMVCVNPAYRTSELEFVLNQAGCRLLLAAPRFKTSDYEKMWEEVTAACPGVARAIFFESPEWQQLLDSGASIDSETVGERSASLSPTDPINIQYTSGTTGLPKGATLTHRNILNNGYFVGRGCGFSEEDRICIPVPFYHCFGMVMGNLGATTHGACMVIPNDAFEPLSVLETVEAERCTALYGVPTMFIAELAEPRFGEFDLGSLRTGIMAGSPCPEEVMRRVIDEMNMSEVTIAYGMTETSPVSTQTRRDDPLEHRVGSVGRVHPHVEIRIVHPETGSVVARGESGEFLTRGYSVMDRYWNEPEKTHQAVDSEGWMHTGDLAVMDSEGYVRITGRIKDLIIRGGENISPREVEEFLYRHPEIEDVQVVGVPDDKFGEAIYAFVRVQAGAGAEVNEESIRAYCEGQIAHYKIPRHVRVVDAFPMTVTGKVQKYKLRAEAIQALGLQG